jgi:hypothetical protein
MTTERDELSSNDRCGVPNCNRPADGLFCSMHKAGGYTMGAHLSAPPERLEQRARLCGVVDESGQPCSTWTLHPAGCLRHRRQRNHSEDFHA